MNPTLAPSSTLVPIATHSSALVQCAYGECTVTRIAPGCKTGSCRRHCLAAGGCDGVGPSHLPETLKSNTITTNSQPVPSSTIPSQSPAPAPAAGPSTFQRTSSGVRTLDPRPDPKYMSHIEDVFTAEWAANQSLVASKRDREAELLENTRRTKSQIIVHAQLEVSYSACASGWFAHRFNRTTVDLLFQRSKMGLSTLISSLPPRCSVILGLTRRRDMSSSTTKSLVHSHESSLDMSLG